jgi:hypothetical protein
MLEGAMAVATDQQWEKIRALLRDAMERLPEEARARGAERAKPEPGGPPMGRQLRGTWDEAQEFLEHDEFELAYEALVELAERAQAGPRLWRALDEAAELMHIPHAQHA